MNHAVGRGFGDRREQVIDRHRLAYDAKSSRQTGVAARRTFSGHDDDRYASVVLVNLGQELPAVNHRHPNVCDHDQGLHPRQTLQGGEAVRSRGDRVSLFHEEVGQSIYPIRIVVDDQNRTAAT